MTRPQTRLPAARAWAAMAGMVAVLVACGSSEDLNAESDGPETSEATSEPTTEATAEPSEPTESTGTTDAGDVIQGDGYSYTAPTGWEEATGDPAFEGADTLVRSAEPVDGFHSNVNTLITPAGGLGELVPGSAPLPLIRRQLARSTQGRTNVLPQPLEDAELDGSPAIGQQVDSFQSDGRSLTLAQYFAVRGDKSYIVTVTASVTDADAAEAAMQTVISSWAWQ